MVAIKRASGPEPFTYNQVHTLHMKFLKEYRQLEWLILFLRNIPSTFKESFIWFLMTYSFPIIQILVIWGIRQDQFSVSIDILNIILVTNASLYTAILLVVDIEHKEKRILRMLILFCYVVTIVFFAISMVEISKGIQIFQLSLYKNGTLATLVLALIFGLISKYDEVKAIRLKTAKAANEKTSTDVNGIKIQL